jgi:hypothetical protein
MANRAQLVREILKELGVYQAGQDLPPEDFRVIDERLDFEVAHLYSQNIYSLDTVDEVPDEALIPLAQWIAGNSAQLFGLAGAELQLVAGRQAQAKRDLTFLRAMGPTGARQRAEYF